MAERRDAPRSSGLPGIEEPKTHLLAEVSRLQDAAAQAPGAPGADAEQRDESAWWASEAEAERTRRLQVENDRIEQDMQLRRKYAKKAFQLAYAATAFWALMFWITAIVNISTGRPALSDNALITLTSGATLNVIAVFLVVVRGLFPGSKS